MGLVHIANSRELGAETPYGSVSAWLAGVRGWLHTLIFDRLVSRLLRSLHDMAGFHINEDKVLVWAASRYGRLYGTF